MLRRIFGVRSNKNELKEKIKEIQAGNEVLRNDFIRESNDFILDTISKITKKNISDILEADEYSIGLIAFDEAVQSFTFEKGVSFSSFASLVIRRRIIDFLRKEIKENREVDLELHNEQESAYAEYLIELENRERIDEIVSYREILRSFDIKFEELASEVPKHKDSKMKAIEISILIKNNEQLRESLYLKKKLPIKELLTKVDVSKKMLERNRKYIIAMTIISVENYKHLKEFLSV